MSKVDAANAIKRRIMGYMDSWMKPVKYRPDVEADMVCDLAIAVAKLRAEELNPVRDLVMIKHCRDRVDALLDDIFDIVF